MKNPRSILWYCLFGTVSLLALGCSERVSNAQSSTTLQGDTVTLDVDSTSQKPPLLAIVVTHDVKMKHYFPYLDSLIRQYDSLVAYPLTEHLLVRANAWIMDTLASYDYDVRKLKGEFILDQKEAKILREGDTLWLPDDETAAFLQDVFQNTVIDINIPEYKLRILEFEEVKYTFPVRVGRDEIKFLAMAGREVSLRTPIGEGEIVRIEKNPLFMNPVDGKRYYATHRDDGRLTELPQVPFLEPSIDGQRPGSLIHPTTNPRTLGKAYSNGCIGTPEGAAWIIYYHAPVGTKIRFRYDLEALDECGDTIRFKDIYHLGDTKKSKNPS
jgi:L,D-transpeptidase ErfK/SrfK